MVTVRILLGVFCIGAGYWGWGTDCSFIGAHYGTFKSYGKEESRTGALLRTAQKEIGVREVGQNAGPRVDQYCAYVGLKRVAWCACFVSWCHGQLGYKTPKTGWSPALFPAKRQVARPRPGVVMGLYYASLGRIGHCGILESVRSDFCITIEGNTGASGEREGQGVWRKTRHKRTIAKYADWL